MASRLPSTVLRAITEVIEGSDPETMNHSGDRFHYVPTLDDIESTPDRTFQYQNVTVDEYRIHGCVQWDLQADLVVHYTDTHTGAHARTLGASLRVVDDARTLALALRSLPGSLAYVADFQPLASSTTHVGDSHIEHRRSFLLRYHEG